MFDLSQHVAVPALQTLHPTTPLAVAMVSHGLLIFVCSSIYLVSVCTENGEELYTVPVMLQGGFASCFLWVNVVVVVAVTSVLRLWIWVLVKTRTKDLVLSFSAKSCPVSNASKSICSERGEKQNETLNFHEKAAFAAQQSKSKPPTARNES